MPIFNIDNQSQKLVWEKKPDGRYYAHITLGIADLKLPYFDSTNRKYHQIITEEELFSDSSVKSAYGMPILLGHPKWVKYNLNKEGLLIGHTLETFVRDDKTLLMPCVIDDYRGIKLINSIIESGEGNVEASPAYYLDHRQWSEELQAYLQIGRTYDHEAIGDINWGRGGQNIILHTDSKDSERAIICFSGIEKLYIDECISTYDVIESINTTTETDYYIEKTEQIIMTTKKVTYQEKSYEVPEPIADHIEKLESDNKNLKLQSDSLEIKIGVLQQNLEDKKDTINLDSVGAMIKESVKLWQDLTPSFQQDNSAFNPDYSLTPNQIKELYIRKFYPKINLDGKTDIFYDDVWQLIEQQISTNQKNPKESKVKAQLEQLNNAGNGEPQTDSTEDPVSAARNRRLARIQKSNV
jgi:hypothetical protein